MFFSTSLNLMVLIAVRIYRRALQVAVEAPHGVAHRQLRLQSPLLPSAQSMANAIVSRIPNLSFPSRSPPTNGAPPPAPVASPSMSRSAPAGTSTSSSAPIAGPSTSRSAPTTGTSATGSSVSVPIAGPSTLRSSLAVGAGPSRGASGSGSFDGTSVQWSPKKGWTSTARVVSLLVTHSKALHSANSRTASHITGRRGRCGPGNP